MKWSWEEDKLFFLVFIVVLLLVSVALVFVFLPDVEEIVDVEEPDVIIRPENYSVLMTMTWEEMQRMDLPSDFPIDDRINPNLDEQAIFCEIIRIRARGIEEYIRKLSFEWRTPPTFYYVVQLHDTEHTSRAFSTWDTEFIRQEVFRRVDDGLETADVTIKIFEERSIGLLGLRSEFVEVESISLRYCFRTGRWTGDNYFGHPDGYGRFLGDDFEVWFRLRQSTFDSDGIPCWVETNLLMTDPMLHDSHIDHSGDGIPLYWEWYWGFDPFTVTNHSEWDISKDGLSNSDKFNLRQWHADPYQPEIYIEVDFMENTRFFGLAPDFVLFEESKHLLIDKFSQRAYHLTPWASKITVFIDDGHMGGGGELLPHVRGVIDMTEGVISEFYKNNFAEERRGVFRYLIIGDGSGGGPGGWSQPQDNKGRYDTMYVGGSRLALMDWTRGFNVRPQLQRLVQAIQVMHELGHTLGMFPYPYPGDPETILGYTQYPGIDNVSIEAIRYWSNYQSCMNYHMMYRPFLMRFLGKNYGLVLDYSDGSRDEPGHPDRNDWEVIDLRFFKQPAYIGGLE